MKGFTRCLALAAIGWSCWLPLARAQSYVAGDINGDRAVTQADADRLEEYLAGESLLTDAEIEAADVDGDGSITRSDYDSIRRSIGVTADAPNSRVQLDSAYSGVAIERTTGRPLADVEVEIPDAGISVRTDSQGRFKLPKDVPANTILTARLEDYKPYSRTTQEQQGPLRLELDRLNRQTTLILESNVVHLGDDSFSPQSANAGDFRLPSQGNELNRSFTLQRIPARDPMLKIGSLIGLDTREAYRLGQNSIPASDMSPLEVMLNGDRIQTVNASRDNIEIPLNRNLLRVGSNTVTLRTGKTVHSPLSRSSSVPISIPLFGGSISIGVPVQSGSRGSMVDYDDIELANVLVELPDE
ncbi:MAG: dockerin type I domain-containing protein [Cyanobacteria bacterium P01_F01_bin.33]